MIPVARAYLVLYFGLAIPLAWLFWIPLTLINRGIWTPPVSVPAIVWSTLGAISPLVTLGVIQRVSHHAVTLKGIFSNVRWKEARSSWTLASPFVVLGIYLVTAAGGATVAFAREPNAWPWHLFRPDVFSTLNWWILLVIPMHFLPSLLTSPLFEEPGWRGFAFENLQRYLPRDIASLIVGSYWWLWHQGMNLAFGLNPSLFGYLSMLLDSFAIDALYSLSNRNLLAAMLAHQAMGTIFVFLSPLPALWYILVFKAAAVAFLRYQAGRRGSITGRFRFDK